MPMNKGTCTKLDISRLKKIKQNSKLYDIAHLKIQAFLQDIYNREGRPKKVGWRSFQKRMRENPEYMALIKNMEEIGRKNDWLRKRVGIELIDPCAEFENSKKNPARRNCCNNCFLSSTINNGQKKSCPFGVIKKIPSLSVEE